MTPSWGRLPVDVFTTSTSSRRHWNRSTGINRRGARTVIVVVKEKRVYVDVDVELFCVRIVGWLVHRRNHNALLIVSNSKNTTTFVRVGIRNQKEGGCYEWYAHSLVPATSVIYERLGRDDISY